MLSDSTFHAAWLCSHKQHLFDVHLSLAMCLLNHAHHSILRMPAVVATYNATLQAQVLRFDRPLRYLSSFARP